MSQSIERIAVTHLAWIPDLCLRHDIRPDKILGDTPLDSMSSLSWSRYAEILATAGKYFSPDEIMTAEVFPDLDVFGGSALHPPSAFKLEDHYLSLFGPEGLIQTRFPIQSQWLNGGKKHLVLQFSMQPNFDRCPVLFYLIAAQMKQIALKLERSPVNIQMEESAEYTIIGIGYSNERSLGAGLKRLWKKLSAANSGHPSLQRIHVERERTNQALQQVKYDLLATQEIAKRNVRSFEQLGQLVQDTSWMMRGELIESVSPSVAELLGYSEAEFVRLRLKDLVAESHQSLVTGMLDQLNEDGSETTHQTIALNHKHLGEIWISLHATTIRNLDGQSMTWFIASDTNERERFQHQISEKENNFQAITDSALDAIITYDNECRIVYANPAASKVFGYPHHELMALNIKMLLPESLGGKTIRTIYRAASPASLSGVSLTGLHQARKLIPLEVSFAGHLESGELLTTCIIRDITNRTEQEVEKLALEAQVQAAQKMEAIGQLTGGIAHDFNNLLVAIVGYTELAERDPDPDSLARHLAEIRKAGERGRNMTQQLLTFSRKKTLALELIELDATLLDIRDFITRLLPSNIDVRFILESNNSQLMADETQLEQIIMNLAVNARDAMPKGGTLTIKTEATSNLLSIIVTDTGIGMNAQTQQKLFEPFFTTKAEGQGTGLGLSVVFGIVKQHEGHIDVASAPGGGTTFTISLPLSSAVQAPCANTSGSFDPSTSHHLTDGKGADIDTDLDIGTETILIVEDNEQVRRLASLILKGAGYQIHEAANGKQALAMISDDQHTFDAVLMNVILPKTPGLEVAAAIRLMHANIQIAFTSGYPDDHPHIQSVTNAGYLLIKKPFGTQQLRSDVRELFDVTLPSIATITADRS